MVPELAAEGLPAAGLSVRCGTLFGRGPLAQLVEQGTLNPQVIGSIPVRPISGVGGSGARGAGQVSRTDR